jgi:hypothetical protein
MTQLCPYVHIRLDKSPFYTFYGRNFSLSGTFTELTYRMATMAKDSLDESERSFLEHRSTDHKSQEGEHLVCRDPLLEWVSRADAPFTSPQCYNSLYKVMLDTGRDPVQYCNISNMLQADSFALSEGRTGAVPDYRSKLSGIDGVHV